jgi:hypothetical protein
MSPQSPKTSKSNLLRWAGIGALFAFTYSQSPLYSSNQNQYFLHGFARAGLGFLKDDWLANTLDPTPVFTVLVQFTISYLDQVFFYLFAMVLIGVYFYSLFRIAIFAAKFEPNRSQKALLIGVVFLIHSIALRVFLSRAIGGEWEYLFDGGVAGQRLLGPVLQPSMFGALLLLSIHSFLSGHELRALLLNALAATIHPTYLLSAALITAAYLFIIWRDSRVLPRTLRMGLFALVLVLPIAGYLILTFYPPSAAAQEILADFRLPAHTDPQLWIDATVFVKIALVSLAIVLVRKTKLFPILVVSAAAGVALSALQLLLNSAGLALLFPWRVSTYLVPISSTVLAAWLVKHSPRWKSFPAWISYAGILSLATIGGASFWLKVGQQHAATDSPLMEVVREVSKSGDLFLIPPRMQDFRLETVAPVFADFKSIPYQGDEVMEWYQRNRLLDWFYRDTLADIDCGLVSRFRDEYGVTHVVLGPLQMGLQCPALQPLYDDGNYALMEIVSER